MPYLVGLGDGPAAATTRAAGARPICKTRRALIANCGRDRVRHPIAGAAQQQILALARAAGSVIVDDLALRFDVTPQTIRKDLNELCDARLLVRTHGGAMLASGVHATVAGILVA